MRVEGDQTAKLSQERSLSLWERVAEGRVRAGMTITFPSRPSPAASRHPLPREISPGGRGT